MATKTTKVNELIFCGHLPERITQYIKQTVIIVNSHSLNNVTLINQL